MNTNCIKNKYATLRRLVLAFLSSRATPSFQETPAQYVLKHYKTIRQRTNICITYFVAIWHKERGKTTIAPGKRSATRGKWTDKEKVPAGGIPLGGTAGFN